MVVCLFNTLSSSCQSGHWKGDGSLPEAYSDHFVESGLTLGRNLCSSGNVPQRTYNLVIETRSVVMMALVAGGYYTSSAGIGFNNRLCGYNAYEGAASGTTSSASCSFILPDGEHEFHFCAIGSSGINGSIIVMPIGVPD